MAYLDNAGVSQLWAKIKAVFVSHKLYAGTGTAANAQATNGNVKITLADTIGGTETARTSIGIQGSGGTTVTSNASGTITVNSTAPASAATATPLVAGTGAVGTSAKYAREDHVHPAQTTVNGHTVNSDVPSGAVFTDTKVNTTLATTTKAYLLGTSTTPTSTAQAVTAVADTGVYLDTTAGKLTATSFAGSGASLTSLNGSNISSGTVAAARIANLDAAKITSGTFDAARIPDLSGTYALKSDISSMYKYKGSVATESALPSTGNTAGDVYNIVAASSYGGAGMNVAWTGTEWDALGEAFSITSITESEINTICV